MHVVQFESEIGVATDAELIVLAGEIEVLPVGAGFRAPQPSARRRNGAGIDQALAFQAFARFGTIAELKVLRARPA